MSDVMMFGIAKMPYEMAMGDEMSRRQFYANTQRLAAALEAAREDAEVAHVEPKNGTAVLHERCLPLAMIGQRVRIVPEAGQGVGEG